MSFVIIVLNLLHSLFDVCSPAHYHEVQPHLSIGIHSNNLEWHLVIALVISWKWYFDYFGHLALYKDENHKHNTVVWLLSLVFVITDMVQLESAELEREQQRVELEKLAAAAEARERCLREEMDEKVRMWTAALLYYAKQLSYCSLPLCWFLY